MCLAEVGGVSVHELCVGTGVHGRVGIDQPGSFSYFRLRKWQNWEGTHQAQGPGGG